MRFRKERGALLAAMVPCCQIGARSGHPGRWIGWMGGWYQLWWKRVEGNNDISVVECLLTDNCYHSKGTGWPAPYLTSGSGLFFPLTHIQFSTLSSSTPWFVVLYFLRQFFRRIPVAFLRGDIYSYDCTKSESTSLVRNMKTRLGATVIID